MAKQVIDVTTPQPNGKFGEPIKTAMEKTNANFTEVYNGVTAAQASADAAAATANAALPRNGSAALTGDLTQSKNIASEIVQSTPNATNRYRRLANISDAVDGGYRIDRWNGSDWVEKFKIENTRVGVTADFDVRKNTPAASLTSPGGNMGWRGFANVSDTVDGGYSIQNIVSGTWTTRMSVNNAGTVTAVAFNPTSTADVKDYIVGYAEDACAAINRLVVIRYKYRPDYVESDKTFIGLLEENVKCVVPDAANDSATVVEEVDGEEVERFVPGNIDMMQILALSIRSHQQKSKRIRDLEAAVAAAGTANAGLVASIAALSARLDAVGL